MDEPKELDADSTLLPSGRTFRLGKADDPILHRVLIRFPGPAEREMWRAAKARREAAEAAETSVPPTRP